MKNIKLRLTIMNFLQFFVWGSWLISLGGYLIGGMQFTGTEVGMIFAGMGIASLIMPSIIGIIADKWINAERLLGICHLLGAVLLFLAAHACASTDDITIGSFSIDSFTAVYGAMLLYLLVYMPTLSLVNTVSYSIISKAGLDVIKDFPPIRVWGTVGFIVAMWLVDLTGFKDSGLQLVMAAAISFCLGLYSFTLPACPPIKTENKGVLSSFGLDALHLFKQKKMVVFFLFSILLGAALQITNTFGGAFLDSFKSIPEFADSFGVRYPIILLSISQISETVFILFIPFFMKRFGIKQVMLMSMFAWVLRFGLFALGDPGSGLPLLILSMLVYGLAFDFFNISGSLFVELETSPKIRASAQGLFFMMTNGLGAIIGTIGSGRVVDLFTTYNTAGDAISRDWPAIWWVFAAYSAVVGVLFWISFRYKEKAKGTVSH